MRLAKIVLLVGVLIALRTPPAAAQVSFDTASLSATDAGFLAGSSVATTGTAWTLSLPGFFVPAFETGTIEILLPITTDAPYALAGISYGYAGAFAGDGFATALTSLADAAGPGIAMDTVIWPPPAGDAGGLLVLPGAASSAFLFASITLDGGSGSAALGTLRFTAAAVAVPEPSTLLLIAAPAAMALLARRRSGEKPDA